VRSRARHISGALRQFQQQAHSLLNKLRRDIRSREAELACIKAEEQSLSRVAENRTGSRAALSGPSGAGGKRIDWSAVLEQLPKQFKASNIRKIRRLKDKRSSEIFAAITRWIETGSVRRKARGIYERAWHIDKFRLGTGWESRE
jgi:hypothetical protein